MQLRFSATVYNLQSFLILPLNEGNKCVKYHCDNAEKNDGHKKPIHFKDLTGVDNKIS